ncbi:MAG: polyprenol monophosphomannose synthase [Deltaproteobacteria bacterium]
MKKVVVIPTYNEKENLERIARAVLAVDPENEVLVVDDNSPDGTGDIADRLVAGDPRVHVLHRPGKEGLGPAYRAGFARALELGADLVVQMDADFSHPVDALPHFYSATSECDVVLGSRYVDGVTVVNWPMGRLMLSYFGNVYAKKVLGGLPVMDATGGFKCWKREVLEAIDLAKVRSNGYGFQIEMSYRAWCLGYRLRETPIIFVDRKEGSSKMTLTIALEAVFVVWWLRLQGMLGRLSKPRRLSEGDTGASDARLAG